MADRLPDGRRSAAGTLVIARPETNWQKAPAPILRPDGRIARISLARWTRSELTEPLEVSADHVDDSHFVTYSLRRADVDFSIARTAVTRGIVQPNRILLQGPTWQKRQSLYRDSFDFFRVYFPQSVLAECLEASRLPAPSSEIVLFDARFVEDPIMDSLIRSLVEVDADGGPLGPAFVDGVGLALASRLILCHASGSLPPSGRLPAPMVQWRLRRAIDYIEAHLSEPIYLAEVSATAGLSSSHFSAQFRAALGVAPYAYILRRRVTRAQDMLRWHEFSVEDVATALGFSSAAHFVTAFRKVTGMTPGRWREIL
ncbi:HTH-type transcriptional activator RhaR [Starkeya nomas]|uniref:HTH-type transcriptional activator RhaR n=1 Tax=Starkeya nomas TaxID=2666134 RepID=A0A5S9NM88_9HYPH|nr:AraC family transcriptional regulator [Starkeya nomas]CAA0090288.1 HTH-type transcriptional activator RhaR [Starkeya nomas]